MRSGYRVLAALCSIAISVNTGCAGNGTAPEEKTQDAASAPVTVEDAPDALLTSMHTATEKDLEPSSASGSAVAFTADGAQCMGSGLSATGNVVTITAPGSYSVSGSCQNGQLIVNCSKDDDVYLVLNGLSLTCQYGPAILCESADKLTVTLNGSSVNTLSDGAGYSTEMAEDTGAALFSRDTLVINGTGSLTVNGVYKDGIKSKDGLKLCGGSVTVNSAEDGIVGKDYLLAAAGTVVVNSGLDGMKSTNSASEDKGYVSISGGNFTINSGSDGIQAESTLLIKDGTINITAGGGSAEVEFTRQFENYDRDSQSDGSALSMKGLKAGKNLNIDGGAIIVDCADDALHSNGDIAIGGGRLKLNSGDDGIHADSVVSVSGGAVNILKSYEGIEGRGVEISGGTISLISFDDGLNASGDSDSSDSGVTPYISISGGSVTANAGGDGIDSNGTISMSGGTLVVFGPVDGANGALDYDKSFALSGGTLIALGSRRMAQAPSTLSQPCLSVYSNADADSTIEVRGSDGTVIISTITPKQCESLIFSSPDLKPGETYSIYANDQLLTEVEATEGVSGGGASGLGFGTWSRDGDPNWGRPGEKPVFTRPEKPADQSTDGSGTSQAA